MRHGMARILVSSGLLVSLIAQPHLAAQASQPGAWSAAALASTLLSQAGTRDPGAGGAYPMNRARQPQLQLRASQAAALASRIAPPNGSVTLTPHPPSPAC